MVVKRTKRVKRKSTKWYYMADTTGKVRLVGLVPANKLTAVGKSRKKDISKMLKRK